MSEEKLGHCLLTVLRLQSSFADVKDYKFWISTLAEFLGTFILVYIGSHSGTFAVNSLQVGMGFGFGGTVAIYCIGNISGGHINPAVSFGLLIARQISFVKFLLYSLAQIAGAVAGSYLLQYSNQYSNRTPYNNEEEGWNNLFVLEIIITFFLVFTVMRMCVEERTDHEKAFAPFIIGLAIMLGVFSGGEIGGGSMNPAASIGLSMKDSKLWVYIIAPFVGSLIAALFQQILFTSKLSINFLYQYLISPNFESKKGENNIENGDVN